MKNPLFKEGIKPGIHRLGGVGELKRIRIRDIHSPQRSVDEKKLAKLARFTKNMPGTPTVSHAGHGKYVLKDGNHRVNAAIRQGKRVIEARVQKLSSPSPLIQFVSCTTDSIPRVDVGRRIVKRIRPIVKMSSMNRLVQFTTGRLLGGGILAGTAWEDSEDGKRILKAATQQKNPRASDVTGVKRIYRDNPDTGKRVLDRTEVVVEKGKSLIRQNPGTPGARQILKKGEWEDVIKPVDLRDVGGTRAAIRIAGVKQTKGEMEGTMANIRGTARRGDSSGILRDAQINRQILQKYRRSLNEQARKAGQELPHPQAEPMSAEKMRSVLTAPKGPSRQYIRPPDNITAMPGVELPPVRNPGVSTKEQEVLRSARDRLGGKGGLVEQEMNRRKVLSQRLYGRIRKNVESKLPRKIASKTDVEELLKPITRPHDPSEVQEIVKRKVVSRSAAIEEQNRQLRVSRVARQAEEIGRVEIPQGFQPPPAEKRSVRSPLVLKTVSEPGRVVQPYEELANTLGIKAKSGRTASERLGRIRERFNRLASPDAEETRKITGRLIDSGRVFRGGTIPIPKASVDPSHSRLKLVGAGGALIGAGLLARKLMSRKPEEEEERKRIAMSSRGSLIQFAKATKVVKKIVKGSAKRAKKLPIMEDTGGSIGPIPTPEQVAKWQTDRADQVLGKLGPKLTLKKERDLARGAAEAAIKKAADARKSAGEASAFEISKARAAARETEERAGRKIAGMEESHAAALKDAGVRRTRGMEGAAIGGLVAGTGLGGWLMARDKKKEVQFGVARQVAKAAAKGYGKGWAFTAPLLVPGTGQAGGAIGATIAGVKEYRRIAKPQRVLRALNKKGMQPIFDDGLTNRQRDILSRLDRQGRKAVSMQSAIKPIQFLSKEQRDNLDGATRMGASAGLSGGVGGLAIGLLSRPRQAPSWSKAKPAPFLKKLGRAAKLGTKAGLGLGVAGAGASLLGSAFLGAPKESDKTAFTKRGAIGGAVAGAALGTVAGGLSMRPGKTSRLLARYGKIWLPVEAMQKSGPAARMAIGAGLGTVVGAAHLADEGQQVDTMRNLKKQPMRMSSPLPLLQFARGDQLSKIKAAMPGLNWSEEGLFARSFADEAVKHKGAVAQKEIAKRVRYMRSDAGRREEALRDTIDRLERSKAETFTDYLSSERRGAKSAKRNLLAGTAIGAGGAALILKMKKKEQQMSSLARPIQFNEILTGKLAADRYRKKIHDEDLDRRDANILRTTAAGAALGGLLRGKKGALIGAAAGAPLVPLIRAGTERGKDMYGDRTREAKQVEGLPWKLAGLGATGVLAHRGNQILTNAKIGLSKWGRRAKYGAIGAAGLYAASKLFSSRQKLIRFAMDDEDYGATERNLLRQGLQHQQDKDWRKVKSATNKAVQGFKRTKRLAQDVVRSVKGEKNVDSRGRERQREWDKPWFRNMLNTGIIGGAAVGALAIKRGINPKGNLGQAIANIKQGVLTEKLSKVAPRTVGAYRKAKTFMSGAGDEAADVLNKSEAVVSPTGPLARFNKWVTSGHGVRAVDDPDKALKALKSAEKKRIKGDTSRHSKTIGSAIQGILEHSSRSPLIQFDLRVEGDRVKFKRELDEIARRQKRADAGQARKANEKTKDITVASVATLGGLATGKRWGRLAEMKAQGLPVPDGIVKRIWRGIKAMSSQDPLITLNARLDLLLN